MSGVAGKISKDMNLNAVQVFSPYKTVSVVATEAWTPGIGDLAFRVSEDVGMSISGGTAATLLAGSITGIVQSKTYTFSVSTVIEVM